MPNIIYVQVFLLRVINNNSNLLINPTRIMHHCSSVCVLVIICQMTFNKCFLLKINYDHNFYLHSTNI